MLMLPIETLLVALLLNKLLVPGVMLFQHNPAYDPYDAGSSQPNIGNGMSKGKATVKGAPAAQRQDYSLSLTTRSLTSVFVSATTSMHSIVVCRGFRVSICLGDC